MAYARRRGSNSRPARSSYRARGSATTTRRRAPKRRQPARSRRSSPRSTAQVLRLVIEQVAPQMAASPFDQKVEKNVGKAKF